MDLTVTDPAAIGHLHETVLKPSFPDDQLFDVGWFIHGADTGQLRLHITTDDTGPVAVAVTEQLDPSPATLLAYLAVRPDRRGLGLGSALHRRVLADTAATSPAGVYLAEVEQAGASPDAADRLRFYARHGARTLDLPYDPHSQMDLLLLWAPAAALRDDGRIHARVLGPAVEALLCDDDTVEADWARRTAWRAGGTRLLDLAALALVAA